MGTPILNLLASLHRRRSPPSSVPQRIGVMCSPALGDTLLFSSALQDLRAALPAAEIVHLCMRQNLAAAEIIPGADRRLLIDLTAPAATVRALRRERFDVLLDFTSWQRLTACYTLLSRAGYTVGFQTPGQRRSRGYDRRVLHTAERHEIANFRALLLGSGLPVAWGPPHPPAIHVAEPVNPPFADAQELIALHLWASGQRAHLREWPEDRWVALAHRLARPDTLFVVTGAPADHARMMPFVARLTASGLSASAFISPDGFLTLASVLRRSRLVVTVNTGVMHLAAIGGARTVALNGPNRNARWGPVGPRALGVEAPGEGCGFLHLGFNFDGHPENCMDRISVDAVAAACRALEAAIADGPPPASTEGDPRDAAYA